MSAGPSRRLALAAMLSLAGCSVLPSEPYPDRRNWPLVVRRPEALPPRRNGTALLVRTVSASPELEARGLQWLRPDGSVHVDYYEQWAVPPAQAVDDDLRQWLAASGIYAAVLAPGSRLSADLVLEGELETFIADVPAGMARARLAVVLLDERPNPAKVKLQRTFTADAPLAGGTIPQLVDALRAALRDVLQQVELALAPA
jgi:cholesterol transport system auxiliary component